MTTKDDNRCKNVFYETRLGGDCIKIRTCHEQDEPNLRALFYDVNSQLFSEGLKTIIFNYITYVVCGGGLCSYAIFRNDYRAILFGLLLAPASLYYLAPTVLGKLMAYISLMKEKDFKNGFVKYYNSMPGKRLLICVEQVSDEGNKNEILGMVGIDEADIETKGHHKGLRKVGDAEMKRMNVATQARSKGLSKLMYNVILNFCEGSSYKRMVLSTSSFNYIACTFLYPKLGFKALNRHKFAKNMEGVFYAIDLTSERVN